MAAIDRQSLETSGAPCRNRPSRPPSGWRSWGSAEQVRQWLLPSGSMVDLPNTLADTMRSKLVQALEAGLQMTWNAAWLARIESAQQTNPRDTRLQYLVKHGLRPSASSGARPAAAWPRPPQLRDDRLRRNAWRKACPPWPSNAAMLQAPPRPGRTPPWPIGGGLNGCGATATAEPPGPLFLHWQARALWSWSGAARLGNWHAHSPHPPLPAAAAGPPNPHRAQKQWRYTMSWHSNNDNIQIIIHLISALTAGGIIGLERSFHGRPASFAPALCAWLPAC